jgi:hypothetical protein
MTTIYELNSEGNIIEKAQYTIEPKKALIAYIMQAKKNNNTWQYPEHIDGIKESQTKRNHYYYDMGNIVLAAYPCN